MQLILIVDPCIFFVLYSSHLATTLITRGFQYVICLFQAGFSFVML